MKTEFDHNDEIIATADLEGLYVKILRLQSSERNISCLKIITRLKLMKMVRMKKLYVLCSQKKN